MTLTLVIGNKNYSSWSMRPWVALKAGNIAFEEVLIPLYTTDADKQRILGFTRSGKVPALVDGDVTVWDSLAMACAISGGLSVLLPASLRTFRMALSSWAGRAVESDGVMPLP